MVPWMETVWATVVCLPGKLARLAAVMG